MKPNGQRNNFSLWLYLSFLLLVPAKNEQTKKRRTTIIDFTKESAALEPVSHARFYFGHNGDFQMPWIDLGKIVAFEWTTKWSIDHYSVTNSNDQLRKHSTDRLSNSHSLSIASIMRKNLFAREIKSYKLFQRRPRASVCIKNVASYKLLNNS